MSESFQRTYLSFVFCGGRNSDPRGFTLVHQTYLWSKRLSLCIQQTAFGNQAMLPNAAFAVVEKFYLDNYLDSLEDPDVTFELSQELVII